MGIRQLSTFICKTVPSGFVPVDMEKEIGKAARPVIVVDLISLYVPLSEQDPKGLFCGGRFNVAYATMDAFFGKLVSLGAQLVFFYDGPVQASKNETWLRRQDERYERNLRLIDAVDYGTDIDRLSSSHDPPYNFRYPLKYLARKHGKFVLSMANEADQELASYASKVGALAIIASDTDFLIYEGEWRMWSAKDINFTKLTTKEFNRKALLSYLSLTYKQMPLFGTLGGNDIIQFDEVKGFLDSLGAYRQKFINLARYVREQSVPPNVDSVMKRVFGYRATNKELRERFEKSLQFYQTGCETPNLNTSGDAVQDFLLRQDTPLFYQIWHGMPIDLALDLIDMRGKVDFGPKHNDLLVTLILRMAGIIRYDGREKPGSSTVEILTKLKHTECHKRHTLQVVFPENIEPPPLDELTSQESDIRESYLDNKYQLCAWVVSDQIDALALKSVPSELLVTVLTLSYLVHMKVIKMFEADLFLQMAYDMVHNDEKFSHGVTYPRQLEGRPFRLTFLYQRMYILVARVVRLVGLDDKDFRDDPLFDGVWFHQHYNSWREGRSTIEQESIKMCRVYDFGKV